MQQYTTQQSNTYHLVWHIWRIKNREGRGGGGKREGGREGEREREREGGRERERKADRQTDRQTERKRLYFSRNRGREGGKGEGGRKRKRERERGRGGERERFCVSLHFSPAVPEKVEFLLQRGLLSLSFSALSLSLFSLSLTLSTNPPTSFPLSLSRLEITVPVGWALQLKHY